MLFAYARSHSRIRIINRTSVENVEVEDTARVDLRDLDTGAVSTVNCRYLIGCDGARSIVRKAIGTELSGDAVIQRVQSTYIRAPGLIDRQQSAPADPEKFHVRVLLGRAAIMYHGAAPGEEISDE